MNAEYGFSTNAIHAAAEKDQYGALVTPIYQSSTFIFDSTRQGGARFALEEPGYIYSRLGTPTCTVLENRIAELEGGEAAVATCSGMGAVTSTIWTLVSGGDEIVADKTLYGCTFEFFEHHLSRFGVTVKFIDITDEAQLKAALSEKTSVVYLETPANPNLKITDIEKTAKIAHDYNPNIKVVCDNTFSTCYLQKPLSLGADVVVYSATKYINGHGDLLAGFVIGKKEIVDQVRLVGVKDLTGAVLASNEAFLVMRGLKTLEVRLQRQCDTAMKVAQYLKTNDKVEVVYYPGLEDHEGHDVAVKQMHNGFGGVVSFIVKGGRDKAAIVADNVKVATLAVSLGATETLIEHPASMTHSTYNEEELEAAGIPGGLIRYAVGLENAEDLIADLEQAFAKID